MFRTSGPAGQFKVVVYNTDGTVRETLQPYASIILAKEAMKALPYYTPFVKARIEPVEE